ncbi:hypothetical protein AB0H76_37135 [Nocardia sp. NPDC050712]|uniref:hypothetical protein n=1 Tax=Nocardia sp. NPDC050712 TaxID=3155518 RepID=UPI0033D8E18C
MAGRLEVYVDRLEKAGGKTDDVRDRLNTVLSTLKSSIAGRGTPWGVPGDTIGDQFANGENGYLASRDGLAESTTAIAGTFGKFSEGQLKGAKDLRAMDDGNADQYR